VLIVAAKKAKAERLKFGEMGNTVGGDKTSLHGVHKSFSGSTMRHWCEGKKKGELRENLVNGRFTCNRGKGIGKICRTIVNGFFS